MRSSESFKKFTEYAPSHASSPFFSMTLFCKQKEFNSEFIFILISEYDFGYYVVNDRNCHFWLNAYFVKELHWIGKCLWACPKLKSLPQRFENENAYIKEMYLINGFDQWLRLDVPGFRFESANRVGPGSRVTTGLIHNRGLVGASSPCTPPVPKRGSHNGVSNGQ